MKTKVVTTVAAILVLAVVWIAWPGDGTPPPNATEPTSQNDADLAGGGVSATNSETDEHDLEREKVSSPPPTVAPTTGALVVHVRYAKEPVAGAGLTVMVNEKGGDFRVGTRRAVTDSEGTARFDDLPPGDFRARPTTRPTASTAAVIEAGVTTECTLTLDGGVTLTGIVVDGNDVPIGGALIETGMPAFSGVDAEQVAVTAADGTFTIRQSDTLILVGARAPRFASSKLHFFNSKKGATEHVRIVLSAIGGSIGGQVVGPDGEPIANAVVRVGKGRTDVLMTTDQGAEPIPAQVRTDEGGHFRAIGVPSGEQPLMARSPHHAPWIGTCVVPEGGTGSVRIQLVLGVTCRGTVRGPDDQPVVATVSTGDSSEFGACRTTSKNDGSFVLTGLPASEIEIKARRSRVGKAAKKIHGRAGETVECDLELSLGLALRGKVVDPEGKPIAFVRLLREFDDGTGLGAAMSHTNKQGEFLFADCPPDKVFKLELSARNFLPLTRRNVDPRGKPLELQLQPDNNPPAHIRGRLLRPDGSGAVGASVNAAARSPQRASQATIEAEDGSFDIEVAAGTWWLRTEARDHPTIRVWPKELAPGETWDVGALQLTQGGTLMVEAVSETKLSYLILDKQARFVAGLYSPEPPLRSSLLAPGDYVLTIRGEGVAAQGLPFSIASGKETRLDVQPPPGVRQRFVFAAPAGATLSHSVPFHLYKGADLVTWDSAQKPAQNQYSHAMWLTPGDYSLKTTAESELQAQATFTVAEKEGPIVRVSLR